ncbi:T9SS type A sorting domain-containing protein [Lacinutrix sp. C3R15]|uniref:T9SS type A sorting domain-containing protein n=1 Tax=Flavobacteriaceae TaxID=49546 RepID=UPI001C0946FB|nr:MULTISPECIES: T9SS type A sorting domain-containing protein [Flavobacteriaceae]MBU2939539.1 T9SS type A sorting domain-containing protein [Lacinutrix sp. C3R15]MDO6622854.1 T9SS type A sorting domain-containing protein [Oceanihabitans sp. 1_MG-2023]
MKNMQKLRQKIVFILGLLICSLSSFAQTVDLVASVDATPPLEVGETFTYTLEAVAGTTPYRVVQIYLNYNDSAIQLNSFTPDNTYLDAIQTITSESGLIKYSAGNLFNDVTGTSTVFTAVFEVVATSENILITHDIASNGNPNGSGVANTSGIDILGTANDIILATLTTEENNFTSSISVFPNPVSDVMYIKTNTVSNIKNIKIHTLDGKLIQQIKNKNMNGNSIAIPIKHLEEALYFVTITSVDDAIATFKILINN